MEWYYENNGAQAGPISEAELKGLFAEGRITPDALVWRQGMDDWAPYGRVFPAAAVVPSDVAGTPPVGSPRAARGTGGQASNRELRAIALNSLGGNWGSGIAVLLINGIIVNGAPQILPLLGILIQWVLSGPMNFGVNAYFLNLVRGEPAEVSDLFSGFQQFGKLLGIFLLVLVIVYFGALVAAIPGGIMLGVLGASDSGVPLEQHPLFVVALLLALIPLGIVTTYLGLKYSLVYFIVKDEPELGVMDVLRRSGQLMAGRKWKLFWLYLSFIGWHVLGLLAFFIGLLWSFTYMTAAFAAFYDDLGDEA